MNWSNSRIRASAPSGVARQSVNSRAQARGTSSPKRTRISSSTTRPPSYHQPRRARARSGWSRLSLNQKATMSAMMLALMLPFSHPVAPVRHIRGHEFRRLDCRPLSSRAGPGRHLPGVRSRGAEAPRTARRTSLATLPADFRSPSPAAARVSSMGSMLSLDLSSSMTLGDVAVRRPARGLGRRPTSRRWRGALRQPDSDRGDRHRSSRRPGGN